MIGPAYIAMSLVERAFNAHSQSHKQELMEGRYKVSEEEAKIDGKQANIMKNELITLVSSAESVTLVAIVTTVAALAFYALGHTLVANVTGSLTLILFTAVMYYTMPKIRELAHKAALPAIPLITQMINGLSAAQPNELEGRFNNGCTVARETLWNVTILPRQP